MSNNDIDTKEKIIHTVVDIQGNIQTPLYYVPLLREIYKDQKDEIELIIIALQLHSILQITFLRSSAFQLYTGIDIYNKSQRDKFIDTCVNNLINKGACKNE